MVDIIINNQNTEVAPIDFNLEEIKAELAENLQKYKGLVITDDIIPEAKKDRANLRKLADTINAKKIEVKNKHNLPLVDFEKKIKELLAMIDEPVKEIDLQVKAYEENLKEIKKNLISNNWVDVGLEGVPLAMIWKDSWLNATVKIKDIRSEMETIKDNYGRNVALIKEFKSEFEFELLYTYRQTLDMGAVLSDKASREKIKSQKAAAAEAEQKRQLEIKQTVEKIHVEVAKKADELPVETKAKMITIRLEIMGERGQLEALREFLAINQIYSKQI
jgi:hypothetical protein